MVQAVIYFGKDMIYKQPHVIMNIGWGYVVSCCCIIAKESIFMDVLNKRHFKLEISSGQSLLAFAQPKANSTCPLLLT